MTDTNPTIESELEALEEKRAQLEARARTERQDAVDRLKAICKITGPIPVELLDGVVLVRKRGPKAGAKKTRKPRPQATAPVEASA